MIRYKNKVYYDYFIHPVTAMITDEEGNVKHQCISNDRPTVCIHGVQMLVHQIQAYTAWGYIEGYDVHHRDENTLNNDLYNLQYMPHEEHASVTNKSRQKTKEHREALSRSRKGNYYPKQQEQLNRMHEANKGSYWWCKEGEKTKFTKECPGEGWIKGRKYECISKSNR